MKARIKTDFATLYRITERDGTPVELRPGETVPQHADMLRYDLGFCDPKEISKVLFPVFSGKAGRTSPQITRGRWTSFGLLVERYDKDAVQPLGWTTYRHRNEDPLLELVPVTLDEYLNAHPGDGVATWR
jgi:hypothetical protein